MGADELHDALTYVLILARYSHTVSDVRMIFDALGDILEGLAFLNLALCLTLQAIVCTRTDIFLFLFIRYVHSSRMCCVTSPYKKD